MTEATKQISRQKRVDRFEHLVAWQRTRELTREVYRVTGRGSFQRDFGLQDQIRRACVSIMSNLAEGFERGSRAEFHQYLVVAKGSCAEVRSELYVAPDAGHLSEAGFASLMELAQEVARIVAALRRAVQAQRDRSARIIDAATAPVLSPKS